MNRLRSKDKVPYSHILSPLLTGSLLILFSCYQIFINYHVHQEKVLGTTSNLNPTDIISLTNLQRSENGLSTLTPNQNLAEAAQAKAQDMFINEYWDHTSPTDNPPWTFILDAGYDYKIAGENLAKDFDDPIKLVEAWMDSPAHKENILNEKYTDVGIAVVSGTLNNKQTILVVQMFGATFTPEDYAQAIERHEYTSNPYVQSPPQTVTTYLRTIFTNKFLATKLFTLSTIILMFVYIGFQIGHHKFKSKDHTIKQQHWGHIILMITLGILAWVTKDGNIL